MTIKAEQSEWNRAIPLVLSSPSRFFFTGLRVFVFSPASLAHLFCAVATPSVYQTVARFTTVNNARDLQRVVLRVVKLIDAGRGWAVEVLENTRTSTATNVNAVLQDIQERELGPTALASLAIGVARDDLLCADVLEDARC